MIPRLIQQNVISTLNDLKKIIIVLGPRQAGKTILVKSIGAIFESEHKKVVYLNCDLTEDLEKINTHSITLLTHLLKDVEYLLIDEAQRIDNPGLSLKIIHDNFPDTRVIATGSSSFELKNKVSDALTGRYVDFYLFPLSLAEITAYENSTAPEKITSDLMLYGAYPEIYLQKQPDVRQLFLEKIIQSYLFKDILAFSNIRNSEALGNLARALAYQIGSELNENEVANRVKIDRKTLLSYLNILEQSFVVRRLYPYSKNPRREIGRRYKVYFIDLGIRNALIGDFHELDIRNDKGALWENFLIMERFKKNQLLHTIKPRSYFWRNYNGAEVDYIEDTPLTAFEFKYSGMTLSRGARAFAQVYGTRPQIINKDTLSTFLF